MLPRKNSYSVPISENTELKLYKDEAFKDYKN